MLESNKLIEFSIHSDLKNIEIIKPFQTKHFLPNWFKKINAHSVEEMNIKGCVPFTDCISAGYILPLPQDLFVSHRTYNLEKKEEESYYKFSCADIPTSRAYEYNINSSEQELHDIKQVGGQGSFLGEKNGNQNIIKILNPWRIKTPKGYSCLFTTPFYKEEDHFSIISAIVDTDDFEDNINFPIIFNNDKYPTFRKTFKQGTPYVQVIPFKRDSWKRKYSTIKINKEKRFFYFSNLLNRYKKLIWKKKIWN